MVTDLTPRDEGDILSCLAGSEILNAGGVSLNPG